MAQENEIPNNLGNVVALLKQTHEPKKKYIVWAKEYDATDRNKTIALVYNYDLKQWEPISGYINVLMKGINSYSVSTSFKTLKQYSGSFIFVFSVENSNTNVVSVEVDQLGPVALKKHDGSGNLADLNAGDLRAGIVYEMIYTDGVFQLISASSSSAASDPIVIQKTYVDFADDAPEGSTVIYTVPAGFRVKDLFYKDLEKFEGGVNPEVRINLGLSVGGNEFSQFGGLLVSDTVNSPDPGEDDYIHTDYNAILSWTDPVAIYSTMNVNSGNTNGLTAGKIQYHITLEKIKQDI